MILRRVLPLALCAAALSAGCPRRPVGFGPAPLDDPGDVLASMTRAQAPAGTVEGEARIGLRSPQQSGSADHLVAIQAPGSLRLDTLSFFGNPLALLLVHEGRLLLWNLDAAQAWTGPATAETLSAVLPIDLGPEAVVGVLRGVPPLVEGGRARLDLDHERSLYQVTLSGDRADQILWIRPQDHALVGVAWRRAGRFLGRVRYDRHRTVDSGLFPMEAIYEGPGDVEVRIAWREVRLDAPLPDGIFGVALPPGVRVSPLGEGTPGLPVAPHRSETNASGPSPDAPAESSAPPAEPPSPASESAPP